MNSGYGIFEYDAASLRDAPRRFFSSACCGFLLCMRGTLDVMVAGEAHSLGPRSLMLFHPYAEASFSAMSPDVRVIIGEVELTDILPVVSQTVNSENLDTMHRHPVVSLTPSQASHLMDHIRYYMDAASAVATQPRDTVTHLLNTALSHRYGDVVMLEMLRLYFMNRPSGNAALDPRDMVVQRFMLDVRRYCTVHRDTAFYAARSSLSPKYFSTLIRQQSGAAPSQWIIRSVIAQARRLLSDLSLSVKEVAESLHFASQADFTKYFRRYSGLTPTDFRSKVLRHS